MGSNRAVILGEPVYITVTQTPHLPSFPAQFFTVGPGAGCNTGTHAPPIAGFSDVDRMMRRSGKRISGGGFGFAFCFEPSLRGRRSFWLGSPGH